MRRRPFFAAAFLLCTLGLSGTAGANGRLVVLEPVTVRGTVEGDVVAVAGDVVLEPDAHVTGDVVAVLGSVERRPGAVVDGRVVTVTSVAGLGLRSPGRRPVPDGLALRVLAAGSWLLAINMVLLLFPGVAWFASTSPQLVSPESVLLGGIVVVTLFMALVAVLGLGPLAPAGVVALIALTLALKILGLSVLTARLGARFLPGAAILPVPWRASIVLTALLAFRLVPLVGGLVWTVTSVVALGSGVITAAAWGGALAPLGALPGTGSQR